MNTGNDLQQSPQSAKNYLFSKNQKIAAAISILLLNVGVLLWAVPRIDGSTNISYLPTQVLNQNVFKFQVYCPIYYYAYMRNSDGSLMSTVNHKYGPYQITNSSINNTDFDENRTYIINIISTNNASGQPVLQYCGLSRRWYGKCTEPLYSCTSPGPMFDFLVGQRADVIWISELNFRTVPDSGSCMNPDKNPVYCSLNYQTNDTVKIFNSPNNTHQQNEDEANASMLISPSDWPSSTHIHGLQVRPQFDGNPLSWVSNSGKQGLGVIPLDKQCYYNNFDNTINTLPPNIKFVNNLYNTGTKINRYMNVQNPGNLWYHDHAMHLTQYNVFNGLYGIYIIRDPRVQKLLPTGANQKFLLKTVFGWANQTFCLKDAICLFESDKAYRYRILNSDGKSIIEISFTTENCSKDNFSTIPFTLIGADSSLFNETMPNIHKVQLGSAERVQLVIQFNSSIQSFSICEYIIDNPYKDPDPDPTSNLQGKSYPPKIHNTISTHQMSIKEKKPLLKSQVTLNQIKTLGVPFTDFSLIQDKDIRVFRMRPLTVSKNFNFLVNGHYDLHKGAAQNPTIGSVEDWYIINTINEAHPIHVHLINFQVLQILKLRHIQNKNPKDPIMKYCSFYEMDFLLQAMILSQNETVKSLLRNFVDEMQINYTYFCDFIKGNKSTINGKPWEDYYYGGIDATTYNVNKQDEVDPKTRISGIDVFELIQNNSRYFDILNQTNCPYNNTHKYLCRESTNYKPWFQRWKDTALVDPMKVFKYRIRWTKSNYTIGEPQFQYPNDQLQEFPGFIYHCHILRHQDNEMMRGIMMQPPKDHRPKASQVWLCNQNNWEDKQHCLREQCILAKQRHDSTTKSSDNKERHPHQ